MAHPPGAALLVIDMQNGFVDSDGSVARRGAPMPEAARVVAETSELLAAARGAAMPVVYTAHVLDPDYFDAPARIVRRGVLNREEQALVRGTWDAAIADELKPHAGDRLVEKNRYDAFLYTELEQVLRALGVGRLLVCGVATNVCVESTVRSAEQRDFAVTVASDCTSGPAGYHDAALAAMAYVAADVVPWRQGLEALTAA
ncbi:MAG TPA: cysteine hydrolase [Acidimicrobiales bacterium]|jgi:ureidoacrylate peracid hydrolase